MSITVVISGVDGVCQPGAPNIKFTGVDGTYTLPNNGVGSYSLTVPNKVTQTNYANIDFTCTGTPIHTQTQDLSIGVGANLVSGKCIFTINTFGAGGVPSCSTANVTNGVSCTFPSGTSGSGTATFSW